MKTQKYRILSGPWADQVVRLREGFKESAPLRIGPSYGQYIVSREKSSTKRTSTKLCLTWLPSITAPAEDLYP